MKKTLIVLALMGGGCRAQQMLHEDVRDNTVMWGVTDPFGFNTLRWATNEIKRLDSEQTFRLDVTNVIAGVGIEIQHPTERTVLINATDGEIPDGSVTTAKLADGASTTPKLADKAVTAQKIADLAITGNQIANTTITGSKLANNAVNTAQLQNGSVTLPKTGWDIQRNIITGGLAVVALGKGIYFDPYYSFRYGTEDDSQFKRLRMNGEDVPLFYLPKRGITRHEFMMDTHPTAANAVIVSAVGSNTLRFGVYGDYYDSEPLAYTDVSYDGSNLPAQDITVSGIYDNGSGNWQGDSIIVIRIGGKIGTLQ